jgi:hypothetical protein
MAHSRKLPRGLFSFPALPLSPLITQTFINRTGSGMPLSMNVGARVSIQRDISALLNHSTDIQAVCLQSWKKTVIGVTQSH